MIVNAKKWVYEMDCWTVGWLVGRMNGNNNTCYLYIYLVWLCFYNIIIIILHLYILAFLVGLLLLLQANWYKAAQYCRFHGMHLASLSSQEDNDRLEKHVNDFGKCESRIRFC